MLRTILHSDMNSCYASIEAKLNPKLKNKAMAVAGNPENRHGIILAKSQEAKIMGVKTGEAIWQAKIKCPNLILVPPHYEKYLEFSRKARKIYYSYTNRVEPFGLDECWLDVSESLKLFGSGEEIANEIRKRMKNELGITVSVGVSFNKVFAKLGSDLKKPDATSVIKKENFKEIVWPLDISSIIGIGNATKTKLNGIGIYTLGELAKSDVKTVKGILGINGLYLWQYANGFDDRPVKDYSYKEIIKTIGNSSTLVEDLYTNEEVYNIFQILSLNVSKRLREANLSSMGIKIFIRDNNLLSYEFQAPISNPTQSSIILAEKAIDLFKKKYKWNFPIRALGLRVINLVDDKIPTQTDIFSDYKEIMKKENLDKAIYNIRKKYNKNILTFASLKNNKKFPKDRTEIVTLPNGMIR
ncbi:MAG: DNA polymerase IV [Anaerococcus hydrogenalis]|uniref:DNA polymerase IV n=1 Tax=Anaerococcus hydrogenalis TaxID=33029 RepID=UPI0029121045|nr:DNA polymerase IV [Anaerococcus hydrogenalis]MDU3688227.1 DNA polymerase IV [Anaerococcus hydrogenalis]